MNEYDLIENSATLDEHFEKVRDFYSKEKIGQILKRGKNAWTAPYIISPSLSIMTHIEKEAWHELRHYGQVPMYPQLPVDKYFVDFGNPCNKIALELDGTKYHDEAKDKKRDEHLYSLGWKTYRIKGAECFTKPYCIDEESLRRQRKFFDIEYWMQNTLRGVIHSIDILHFMDWYPEYFDIELNDFDDVEYSKLKIRFAIDSLKQHSLIAYEPF